MRRTLLTRDGWLLGLALGALAAAPLAVGAASALASAPVRVVGCNLASLSPDLVAAGVTVAGATVEDGTSDDSDDDEYDQPIGIVGSIPKPRGVSEDDSRKLTELNIATITRDRAIETTLSVVVDPTQRTVTRAELEGANGYLVWAVKTVLNDPLNGPDPKLEASIDAGGDGQVLSIECDPDDN